METVIGAWNSAPWVQAVMTGGIVFLSALVIGGISVALPFTVPLWIKALSTGILAGVIIFFLSGGAGGGVEQLEGEETDPTLIEEDINLSATELILEHEIDKEAKVFKFILGGQELNMDNWMEDLEQKLEQYENLKMIIVKDSGKILHNFYVKLKELNEKNDDIDIIFKDLE